MVTPARCPFKDRAGRQCRRADGHDPAVVPHVVLLKGGDVHVFRAPVKPKVPHATVEPYYVGGPGSTGTKVTGAAP
jgi:hypothetical protein